MARYIGPKSKIARKFKEPIFGPDKTLAKKSGPSKGTSRRRTKMTEYGIQLAEKQKAKAEADARLKAEAKAFTKN